MIVEAGTYTYRSEKARWPADEPAWRAHFLGPSAHNGLCIAEHDPLGRFPGDFPWGDLKVQVVTRRHASGAGLTWVEGSVVGETPYNGHTRGAVHVEGYYWLVYDLLPPSAIAEDAWLSLQFSAETVLRGMVDHAAMAAVPEARLQVTVSERTQPVRLLGGERAAPAGWVSPRYGELHAATALQVSTTGGPSAVATLLEPVTDSAPAMTVEIEADDAGGIGIRITRSDVADYVLLPRGQPDAEARFFGAQFRGTALWLRAVRGRPAEVRALAGRVVRSESLGLVIEIDDASRTHGYRWLGPSARV